MKMVKIFSFLSLFIMMLTVFSLPAVVLAQDEEQDTTDNTTLLSDNTTTPAEPELIPEPEEEPPPEPAEPPQPEPISEPEEEEKIDTITMSTEFPTIEANATETFTFAVEITYDGEADRVFDLNANTPAGWNAYVTPQYDSKRISSISIDGGILTQKKNVKVTATPPSWPLADPGIYTITLEATSDIVIGTIDLNAEITPTGRLTAVPSNQLYNTKAKAGQDSIFAITVTNVGTAPINNITFSYDSPEGWEITFNPDKIDVLEIIDPKTINVNIKPPPKTVAGDYMLSLRASGTQASADKISVRVTVETPTIWGWVGVAIIAIVIIGLIVIFMRFGRR